jgi:hypothetical protein
LCYPYYQFEALFDNKEFFMITNDNKGINQGRAGDYVSQIGGYKAFAPKPLPPDPPIQLDSEMLQFLSQADMALGRLDGMSAILPNVDLFVAMFSDEEMPKDNYQGPSLLEEEKTEYLT